MKSSKVIYEDLSIIRGDEETVLAAVYGDDFSKRAGVWGSPLLTVTVRPQDIPRERIGSELTLAVQTSNKYPSAVPKLDFQNVRGLTPNETSSLMKILSEAAVSLSQTTSPMVCELVQIVEDFLWKHNRDPILAKRSEWEKMRDKENERNRQLKEEEDRIQSFMNEEISEPNRNSIRPVPLKDDSMSNPAHMEDNDHMERVRKELERQREALFDATDKLKNRVFLGFEMNDSDHDSEECTTSSEDPSTLNEDSDDDNIDLDVSNNHISSTSRYSSDFIELGVLGKGGGGEVLKVKNRLDRRICKYIVFVIKSTLSFNKISIQ
jgi:translation initiation factor 2-alpha kinase 4